MSDGMKIPDRAAIAFLHSPYILRGQPPVLLELE